MGFNDAFMVFVFYTYGNPITLIALCLNRLFINVEFAHHFRYVRKCAGVLRRKYQCVGGLAFKEDDPYSTNIHVIRGAIISL